MGFDSTPNPMATAIRLLLLRVIIVLFRYVTTTDDDNNKKKILLLLRTTVALAATVRVHFLRYFIIILPTTLGAFSSIILIRFY